MSEKLTFIGLIRSFFCLRAYVSVDTLPFCSCESLTQTASISVFQVCSLTLLMVVGDSDSRCLLEFSCFLLVCCSYARLIWESQHLRDCHSKLDMTPGYKERKILSLKCLILCIHLLFSPKGIMKCYMNNSLHPHTGAGSMIQHVVQARIASAIYPTASLMNHSCKPNIINRLSDCNLCKWKYT